MWWVVEARVERLVGRVLEREVSEIAGLRSEQVSGLERRGEK